jgi:hypothetical protein
MNELEQLLSQYRATHPNASDAEMQQVAQAWQSQHAATAPGASQSPSNADLDAIVEKAVAAGLDDDGVKQVVADYQAHQAQQPAFDTSRSLSNMGRAFRQGATYNFGDELGLVDPAKEAAFAKANPWTDLGMKAAGGVLAPAVALAAAPEVLGGLGVASAMGAGGVGLSTLGDKQGGVMDRLRASATPGTALAMAGGALAPFVFNRLGAGISALLNRAAPTRLIGKAGADVLSSDVAPHMAEIDALAPGGTSVGTATIPRDANGMPVGTGSPRFLKALSDLSANPGAAREAEGVLLTQRNVLQKGLDAVGDKMNLLDGDIPVTPRLQSALEAAQDIVGAKNSPDITLPQPSMILNARGQPALPTGPATVGVQDARLTLSQLRGIVEQLANANQSGAQNGAALFRASQAERALSAELRAARPDFGALDRDYALLKGENEAAFTNLKAIQQARGRALSNTVAGRAPGSPSIGVPLSPKALALGAVNVLTGNPSPKAAQAMLDYIVRPSASPDALAALAPKPLGRASNAAIRGVMTALPASVSSLFQPTTYAR